MSQLGSGAGSDYPATLDTAEQQTDGASGTLADANWANDVTSAITAIETELGTDPAGAAADLVTRLAKTLADGGELNNGTTANRPASPTMGQPYYNTSLNRLEIYDTDLADWNAVTGVTDHGALTGLTDDDHTQYAKADGTRTFTGPVNQEKATPYFQLSGTETSGDKFGIKEDGGFLYISRNTGTVGSPSWTDLVRVSTGGVVTLLVDDLVSRDTGNSVNVSMKTHAHRHGAGGEDVVYTPFFNWSPQEGGNNFGIRGVGDSGAKRHATFRPYLVSGTKTATLKTYAISGATVGAYSRIGVSIDGVSATVELSASWILHTTAFSFTAYDYPVITLYSEKADANTEMSATDISLRIS